MGAPGHTSAQTTTQLESMLRPIESCPRVKVVFTHRPLHRRHQQQHWAQMNFFCEIPYLECCLSGRRQRRRPLRLCTIIGAVYLAKQLNCHHHHFGQLDDGRWRSSRLLCAPRQREAHKNGKHLNLRGTLQLSRFVCISWIPWYLNPVSPIHQHGPMPPPASAHGDNSVYLLATYQLIYLTAVVVVVARFHH